MLDDQHGVALIDESLQHGEQPPDVVEVEAGRRLVEQVDRVTGGTLRQLGRQLHALRLATGERRRGLSETDVAEADVHQGPHVARDAGLVGEEVDRLGDRHVEHVGDRLALELDVERVAVVAGAVTDLAGHVHVGQEVHLDLDRAVARARVAATSLDVEAEAAGHVAPHLRLVGAREQLANVVEDAGVGGRIRARGAADRRLVHVDDLVECLDAVDPLVLAGGSLRLVDPLHEDRQQDVAHECGLAGTGHAGDGDEVAQRDLDREVAKVVFAGALDHEAIEARRAANGRNRYPFAARQVLTGDRLRHALDALDRSRVHDLAAVFARTGTDVDDPVTRADRLLVVLDDDHGVAEITKSGERVDQAAVVALMEPDRGFVEDVQGADESGADLRREADSLCFTAGERARRARQREVVEADVEQEAEPGIDLFGDAFGDHAIALAEFEGGEELRRLADRHLAHLGDVLVVDRDRQGRRLEPGTVAGRTRDEAHVALVLLARPLAVAALVAPLDPRDDPLVLGGVRA